MKLTTEKEIQYLRNTPLFQNLRSEELKIISLATENFIYEQGEVIINKGDEGGEAYIIYSGEVEVFSPQEDGKAVILNKLGEGEMFGELALFGEGFRSASVKANKETLVGVISKEKLYEIIREFPDIAIQILKVQTQRFSRTENRLMGLLKGNTPGLKG
ncbi:MAG: cyclic nucleotide-binding domain-containing protein [Candidatus Omnitrophica bacterium]|nr:cyclic nucleotide-binding domain-containing protein [Candidatus Omnitrophota bacterium]